MPQFTSVRRRSTSIVVLKLTSHVVQHFIFITKHCRRSHNGRIGESVLDPLFPLELGAVEDGRGIGRSIQVGNMHEALNSGLRSDLGDPLRTSDMYVGILEVPTEQEARREEKKKESIIRFMDQGRKERVTWSHNHGRRDYTQCQNVLNIQLFVLDSGYPIPKYVPYDINQTNSRLLDWKEGLPWGRFDLDRP